MEEIAHDKYSSTDIIIIENILDDDFCNETIELINKLPLKYVQHSKYSNVECHSFNLDNHILSFEDFYFFPNDSEFTNDKICLINNINNVSINSLITIKKKMDDKLNYLSKILENINDKVFFQYRSNMFFRKIYGSTKLHSDNILSFHKSNIHSINENNMPDDYNMIRKHTIIFALNSDFEGGIFNFPTKNTTFKMNKGSAVIFPPYWTHPHEVSAILDGKFRYTIHTWLMENIINETDL